jgi:hypothetical protein
MRPRGRRDPTVTKGRVCDQIARPAAPDHGRRGGPRLARGGPNFDVHPPLSSVVIFKVREGGGARYESRWTETSTTFPSRWTSSAVRPPLTATVASFGSTMSLIGDHPWSNIARIKVLTGFWSPVGAR